MIGESAKVVATLRLTEFVSYYWETSVPVYDMPLGPYIPLTDHEAAMAELVIERDELQSCFDSQQVLIADLQEEKQTLLTGLEALAGEFIAKAADYDAKSEASDCAITKEWFEGMSEGHIDCANALTRTLASAGLEGNADGG